VKCVAGMQIYLMLVPHKSVAGHDRNSPIKIIVLYQSEGCLFEPRTRRGQSDVSEYTGANSEHVSLVFCLFLVTSTFCLLLSLSRVTSWRFVVQILPSNHVWMAHIPSYPTNHSIKSCVDGPHSIKSHKCFHQIPHSSKSCVDGPHAFSA
jgi:hypothetical protein